MFMMRTSGCDWILHVVCDHCRQDITDALALYAWEILGADDPERGFEVTSGAIFHLHKRCIRQWEGEHGGMRKWVSCEIREFPIHAGDALGLDWGQRMQELGLLPGGAPRIGNARPEGHEWAILRDVVFRRDEYTCRYCGASGDGVRLQCDHVVPVSRGGSNDISNLVTACMTCNASKHDKTPQEWRR